MTDKVLATRLDLRVLLQEEARLKRQLAIVEAEIARSSREFWTLQGYSVMPRRERLVDAINA